MRGRGRLMNRETDPDGISVVMPAYNAAKTIGRAIESVLEQTYGCLELIVIDDCSTDGSLEIARTYAERDERIRILRHEINEGVSAARNRGVNAAQYSWIAFLDSDDYWLPTKLEAQMCAVSKNENCALCFTASAFIDSKGHSSDYVLQVPERVTYARLLSQNIISCSSVLARREDLLAHPMACNPMIHEDYAVWLSLLKEYPCALGVNEPLLVYQVSTESKSGNKLRAARMQWNTYRYCQLSVARSVIHYSAYAMRNMKKYRSIRRVMKKQGTKSGDE